jgi:RNA polymerase sigma-54 factor
MKPSLQLKLGQQLTMTPQLQQAIRLLQLSTMDLQQEIQQALDSNPLLEVEEVGDFNPEAAAIGRLNGTSSIDSKEGDSGADESVGEFGSADSWQQDIPENLPVDAQWDDVFAQQSGGSSNDGDSEFEPRGAGAETLHEHLEWQLNLTRFSDTDRLIAMAIIDGTDDTGRLAMSIDDIHESLIESVEIDLDEVLAVLHRLQQFDPPGVCARDLQECLQVQLKQMPGDTPFLEEAQLLVARYLPMLGSRDYKQIMRRSRLSEDSLRNALALIQTLHPSPGDRFSDSSAQYVIPDVFVRKKQGRWKVELNPDISPRLRINADYARLARRAASEADASYLRDNLQEARWFLKSLQSRNETLLKVARQIVELQRPFLEYGEEAMKPLILADVAQAIEMHESTVSRVTTQKYMHTPRGIFELKFFFSSHVATAEGGECSSTAIRALIRKLVAAESPKKPLSDSKITALLSEQGINVARRTIAKYREALHIPPSNERKRLV